MGLGPHHRQLLQVIVAVHQQVVSLVQMLSLINIWIPFAEFCDRHSLSLEDRLQLFIPICRAVHHAHQKGIIHRDFKPSNVLVALVDGVPVPKVIDLGLAKAIQQQTKLSEQTMFTEFDQVVGTHRCDNSELLVKSHSAARLIRTTQRN